MWVCSSLLCDGVLMVPCVFLAVIHDRDVLCVERRGPIGFYYLYSERTLSDVLQRSKRLNDNRSTLSGATKGNVVPLCFLELPKGYLK